MQQYFVAHNACAKRITKHEQKPPSRTVQQQQNHHSILLKTQVHNMLTRTRAQSLFLAWILSLTRLCVSTHAKSGGGPRGTGLRRLQTDSSETNKTPILILVEGRPGLLTADHLVTLARVFQETYNSSAECAGVQDVVLDGVKYDDAGTGIASSSFTITGLVSGSLFQSASEINVNLRRLQGKSKSKCPHSPVPTPTDAPLLGASSAPGISPPTSPPVPAPTLSPPVPAPTLSPPVPAPTARQTASPTTAPPQNAPVPSPTNAPPTNGPPTTDDMKADDGCWTQSAFVDLYNEAVRTIDLDVSIDQVVNVLVQEYVTCEEYNEFQTDVLVSFTGDPSLSTTSQLEALEASFIQTYSELNSLNPDTCDPFFREAVSVDLITSGQRRLLSHRSLATSFKYVYRVSSRCRGCRTNSRLFGEGSGRRLLQFGLRQLQDEQCVCPVNATEFRAPSEEEFQAEYSNAIEVLKSENVINGSFIESLDDIQEGVEEEANCGKEVTFESTVLLEFSGTHYNVTKAEMDLLAGAFLTVYEAAASNVCDPHSRFLTAAHISMKVEAGDPTGTFDLVYNTTIQGTCQGCNSKLFSVEGEEPETSCLCGPDLSVNRAPTSQEFEIAFNETLANLNLQNVQYLVGVVE